VKTGLHGFTYTLSLLGQVYEISKLTKRKLSRLLHDVLA